MQSVFADQKDNFTTITKIKFRQGDDALIVRLAFCKPISFKPIVVEEVKKDTKKVVVKKTEPKKVVKKSRLKKMINSKTTVKK